MPLCRSPRFESEQEHILFVTLVLDDLLVTLFIERRLGLYVSQFWPQDALVIVVKLHSRVIEAHTRIPFYGELNLSFIFY